MKKIIIIFIFSIGFISCSSNDETKIENSDLIGKWNWISTDGGFAFHIHEKPTIGNPFQLSLMKNYAYSIAQNGNEVESGTYELVIKRSIYSGEMERFIICYAKNQQLQNVVPVHNVVINGIIEVYETNKLEISDNNYDGIGSKFAKTSD
ncbi:hypothetical protein ACM55F_05115 [Flavobacterium sp. XS2P12]|uniref:hypothetical protein n=1 Tax=Flavobacterium melibiosi TaxID=3398734 RepID=UPI003A851A7B